MTQPRCTVHGCGYPEPCYFHAKTYLQETFASNPHSAPSSTLASSSITHDPHGRSLDFHDYVDFSAIRGSWSKATGFVSETAQRQALLDQISAMHAREDEL